MSGAVARALSTWDRTVDMTWSRWGSEDGKVSKKVIARDFRTNCDRLRRESRSARDMSRYFRLPGSIRFRIMEELLRHYDTGKPIRLNSPSFFEPIWPTDPSPRWDAISVDQYFDSLSEVLDDLNSYLWVCPAMRIDIMAVLCMTRRFHVVYSPFVTENLQEAATFWMDKYGPLMKHITLEVDFTKLAGSCRPEASELDMEATLRRPQWLIQKFSQRQRTRDKTAIHSLVILARRYFGCRPEFLKVGDVNRFYTDAESDRPSMRSTRRKLSKLSILRSTMRDDGTVSQTDLHSEIMSQLRESSEDGPTASITSGSTEGTVEGGHLAKSSYCDDEYLHILDPIAEIKTIESLRIIGTSKEYATELANRLWGNGRPNGLDLSRVCRYKSPSTLYPFTPGQKSCVDYGPSRGFEAIKHITDSRSWKRAYTDTQLKGVLFAFLSPDLIRKDGPPSWEHPALRRAQTPVEALREIKGNENTIRIVRKTSSMMSLGLGKRD